MKIIFHIVVKYDATFFDTEPNNGDAESFASLKRKARSSAKSGRERKVILDEFSMGNAYLHVEYAPYTFEVDFADAAKVNRRILASTVDDVYQRDASRTERKLDLDSGEICQYGLAALRLAQKVGKGWFALLVSQQLHSSDIDCGPNLPRYILDALGFAASELPQETWARIINYRIDRWKESSCVTDGQVSAARDLLGKFMREDIDLDSILSGLKGLPYADERIVGLAQAFGR